MSVSAALNGLCLNMKPALGGQGSLAGHGGASVQDLLGLGSGWHPGGPVTAFGPE